VCCFLAMGLATRGRRWEGYRKVRLASVLKDLPSSSRAESSFTSGLPGDILRKILRMATFGRLARRHNIALYRTAQFLILLPPILPTLVRRAHMADYPACVWGALAALRRKNLIRSPSCGNSRSHRITPRPSSCTRKRYQDDCSSPRGGCPLPSIVLTDLAQWKEAR